MNALQPIDHLPNWIKEACANDITVQRVVKDWRMTNNSELILYQRLALRLFEQKNFWEGTAEEYTKKFGPL